jgi:hypothetical protein
MRHPGIILEMFNALEDEKIPVSREKGEALCGLREIISGFIC